MPISVETGAVRIAIRHIRRLLVRLKHADKAEKNERVECRLSIKVEIPHTKKMKNKIKDSW